MASPSVRTRLALSCALGLGIVWALWPTMRTMPVDPWIPGTVLGGYLLALAPYHVLRAGRWGFLVRRLAPVPWRDALLVGLAGYMWIAALPLRLGELARPILLERRARIPIGGGLALVALERITDGLAVGSMFFAATALGGLDDVPDHVRWGAWITIGGFAGVLSAMIGVAIAPPRFGARLLAVTARFSRRGTDAVGRLVGQLREAMVVLRAPAPVIAFVLATAAYWACNVLGLWWLARGCGLEVGVVDIAIVTAVMNLVLVLPGGPAQLGLFQGGVALGLSLVVDADRIATAGSTFAFWAYVCQLSTIVVAGLLAQRALAIAWAAVLRPQDPA